MKTKNKLNVAKSMWKWNRDIFLNICNRFEEKIANISHCHYECQRKRVGLVESVSKQHESDKRIWGMGWLSLSFHSNETPNPQFRIVFGTQPHPIVFKLCNLSINRMTSNCKNSSFVVHFYHKRVHKYELPYVVIVVQCSQAAGTTQTKFARTIHVLSWTLIITA